MPTEIIYIAGKNPIHQPGGHSSYVRAHARAARRIGFEPQIFCLGNEDRTEAQDIGLLHQIASPRFSVRSATVPLHAPKLVRAILGHIADRPGPHLIHGFGLWAYVGVRVRARLARRRIKAITVSSVYTTYDDEYRAKLRGSKALLDIGGLVRARTEYLWAMAGLLIYERAIMRESQQLVANYESVRRLVEAGYGRDLPFRLIPYCSEDAFLRAPDDRPMAPPELERLRPADAPLIVAVSRHDPRKGVETLLRALAQLKAEGINFRACLVGGGELLAAHRRLAMQLGLGDSTLITGWAPDPFAFLAQADIFALPSIQEGSGSVSLLEALQAGAAVVAARIDGISEDVTDGESALLCEPGSSASLAAALRRLIEDASLRQRLARRGHQVYLERFSAEALTSALGELYLGLGFPADDGLHARDHTSPSRNSES